MISIIRKLLLVAATTQLALSGCSTPHRLQAVPIGEATQALPAVGPVRFLVTRETETFAVEARNSLAKEQQWLANQGRSGDLPPVYFLAISGGGDNGAYGAGFLNGWTSAGRNFPRSPPNAAI